MKRRSFILGAAAATAGLGAHIATGGKAAAQSTASKFFAGASLDGGHNFRKTNFKAIDQRWHRQMVKYFSDEPQGTVVIDTRNHYMYWIWENNTAIRYGVGVGARASSGSVEPTLPARHAGHAGFRRRK